MNKRKTIVSLNKLTLVTAVVILIIFIASQTAFGQSNKLAVADNLYQEAVALFNKSTAESLQTAAAKFLAASEVFAQNGEKRKQALALDMIGAVRDKLGDKTAALKNYNAALSLFRALNAKKNEAVTLNSIGLLYVMLGDNRKAFEYLNLSLPLHRLVGNKDGEVSTLNNLAMAYEATGEKQKALEYLNQVIQTYRTVNNKNGQAIVLSNIGRIYDTLGERQKALEYFDQSLPFARAIGDKGGEAITLNNIGLVYIALGDKQKALDYLSQSLPLFNLVGNKDGEAAVLSNMGKAYSDLGEKQKAIGYYEKSLPIRRGVGDKRGEATTLNNLATAYSEIGEKQKAIDIFYQSLPISRAVGDKALEAGTLYNLMFVLYSLKNPRFAELFGIQAFNNFQQLRANIKGLENSAQQNYLKSVEGVYRNISNLLNLNKRPAEAQQVLNILKELQSPDFKSDTRFALLILTAREENFRTSFNAKLDVIATALKQYDGFKRNVGERPPTNKENTELKRLEADLHKANDDYLTFLKISAQEFVATSEVRETISASNSNEKFRREEN